MKVRFVVVSSFVLGVRREMPRRGWSTAPDGWVQIIRGPRPLSESWPKVGRNSADLHPKSNEVRSFEGRWRRPQQFRASPPPEVVVEAAKKRVDGIEAALEHWRQWARSMAHSFFEII